MTGRGGFRCRNCTIDRGPRRTQDMRAVHRQLISDDPRFGLGHRSVLHREVEAMTTLGRTYYEGHPQARGGKQVAVEVDAEGKPLKK
jgi:hypothetical protein